MAYSVNPSSIAVSTVGATAGQIIDAEDIEAINFWMEPVEIDEQEITKWLGKLKMEVNQQTHYIGQSYNPPITSTLEVATASADPTVDIDGDPAALGFKVGHNVEIKQYYAGQTTYFDGTKTKYGRIVQVDAGSFELAANVGAVIPAGSVVRVFTNTYPMATAFDNAPVFRGDRIEQTVSRLSSGFIKVDERMRHVPTHASRDPFVDDMANLRKRMNDELEELYIKSIYQAESGTTPGHIRGMIDWADHLSGNVLALNNKQISIHHLRNRVTQKRKVHRKKAGNTVITDLDTQEALDLVLEPYKLYDEKSNSITIELKSLNFRWGNLTFMPVMNWPDGKILVTSKEDWGAGHFSGMPWKPVTQDEAHTGGPWSTFGLYGDFTLDCYDVQRQIVITGVNTFVDRYAGRRTYGQAG
jgi:hypothetical protein